jgi:hypothetical protein
MFGIENSSCAPVICEIYSGGTVQIPENVVLKLISQTTELEAQPRQQETKL